jgi:hypothetical protein
MLKKLLFMFLTVHSFFGVSVFLSLDIPHYSSVLAFPYMPFESRLLSFPSYIVKPANNRRKGALKRWKRDITNAKSKIKSLEIDRDKAKRKLKSAQRSIQRLRQRIEQSKVQNLTPRKETENIMKEANLTIYALISTCINVVIIVYIHVFSFSSIKMTQIFSILFVSLISFPFCKVF